MIFGGKEQAAYWLVQLISFAWLQKRILVTISFIDVFRSFCIQVVVQLYIVCKQSGSGRNDVGIDKYHLLPLSSFYFFCFFVVVFCSCFFLLFFFSNLMDLERPEKVCLKCKCFIDLIGQVTYELYIHQVTSLLTVLPQLLQFPEVT